MIDRLVDAGAPADRCCRILGVARQNHYKRKRTPTTPRQLRQEWLTGLIREVHVASRCTYGYRRIHAELTMGMGIQVCSRTVSVLMTQAGIHGLPGPVRIKCLQGVVTADDMVNRKFHRLRPFPAIAAAGDDGAVTRNKDVLGTPDSLTMRTGSTRSARPARTRSRGEFGAPPTGGPPRL